MENTNEKNRPLWAPWRIDYILSEKTGECFLCDRQQSSGKKDEFMIIFRGDYSFVMLNAYPYNSGHLMVCPYEHVGDISVIAKKKLNEMMELCVKSKEVLADVMNPGGFNIGFNLGLPAGAGLEEHIHMHIVPRWIGDTNFMPVLGNTRVVPQALQETADLLRIHFS
jgi:ATP adenylyltransferase